MKSDISALGVCCNKWKCVLFSDNTNDRVVILNQDGQHLANLEMKHIELEKPCALCIDSSDNLWIGSNNKKEVKAVKYMRY